MVKIKGKIFKLGNSYAILVKKALIDSEVLKEGQKYEFELRNAPIVYSELYVNGEKHAEMA